MAGSTGPNIVNNGLILNLDAANIKSFKGLSGTNLWYNINRTFTPTNTSTFKVSYGTEQAYIPYFNGLVNTTYCDIYNDYVGGSGQCCPSPFYYHGPNVTVNGSTQYTYQIIFKTTNGYYSTNYMYRYEFGASGLLTEQGVVDASRLESLGNGWYHAWGQFTTNASTTNMTGWLFHYEYLVSNRISVAAVSLTQGSTIHRPEHLINFGFRETRGTTVATNGGWKDLSGNSSHGELINSVSYNSANKGGLVFDGVNTQVNVVSNLGVLSNYTIMFWAKRDSENKMPISSRVNTNFYWFGDNSWYYTHGGVGGEYYYSKPTSIPLGSWGHYCVVYNGSNVSIYRQGVYQGQQSTTGTADFSNGLIIGYWAAGSDYAWNGRISQVQMYKSALTSNEVSQNYNATKSKFGL